MTVEEVATNVLSMLLCYAYILLVIFVSGKLDKLVHISRQPFSTRLTLCGLFYSIHGENTIT